MNNRKTNLLDNLFSKSQIHLDSDQKYKFAQLHDLLNKYNQEYDLTRLHGPEDIIIKHFIDSIYIKELTDLPSPLIDIGTGAGFPGIPLKIVMPGHRIILAESRYKRVKFLEMAVKELKLENIEIYPHMVTDKSFFNVNGAITRALESIDNTLQRVDHFIPEKGKVIFMKGPNIGNDIDGISKANKEKYTIELNRSYILPGTDYERSLLIFNKNSSSFKKTFRIFINSDETMGKIITSRENRTFKNLKKLVSTAGIKEKKQVIVSGKKIIKEMLNDKRGGRDLIIYDGYIENDIGFNSFIDSCNDSGSLIMLKKYLYNELDLFKTEKPLLVADVPEINGWDCKRVEGCILLIPFQDPTNVGTVIRSAAGFGIKDIVILNEASNPYHPRSIRSSGGAVFDLNIMAGPSIYELSRIVKDNNLNLISLDRSGADIRGFIFPEDFLLLPGMEGPGLPEDLKENSVSIPISENMDSLNAAISTSIALYELKRRGKG